MMTNETLETLKTRRSCRAYKPDQITEAELAAVLEAGTYAPTAMGLQSPKIVVIQDAAARAELSRMNAAVMGREGGDPMYGAPSLGLGSCWINRAREMFASEEGKALLKKWGIEGEWEGVAFCILGYPAAAPKPAAPRKADYVVRV